MTKMFNQLAGELFEILKGSGKTLSLFDEKGKEVYQPEDARRIFTEPDKMMLSIDEDGSNSELKVFLSKGTDIPKIKRLINSLRHLSTRFNVMFNIRKYGHDLKPKDFAYQSLPVYEESILEALTGSTRSSYQNFGNSKLVIRHSGRINEEKRGSRTRNIVDLFVEHFGERIRFPIIHLSGARAWAQHINQGGLPHDSISESIFSLAKMSSELTSINKHILHNRTSLSESAFDVRNMIKNKIYEIRCQLKKLSGQRGYIKEIANLNLSNALTEDQDDRNEIANLGILLGINEDSKLYDSLMPVVLLTKGENMVNNINPKFHRVVALENADDLVETLKYEYGFKEGAAWQRNGNGIAFMLPEAFEAGCSYLDLNETAYEIDEAEDKILAYAKKWVGDNTTNMGYKTAADPDHPNYPTEWSPNDIKQFNGKADELAQGLRELLTGSLQVNPVPAASALPANPQAAIALKIGQLITPQSGMQNDMLYNYLSKIHEKIGGGESLSPVEKQVASKAVSLVDSMQNESTMEEDIWSEDDESPLQSFEQVATPMGPGQIQQIDDYGNVQVELQNGKSHTFHSTDIQRANPQGLGMKAANGPNMNTPEMREMSEWFSKFDPIKFLNEDPEDVHVHIHDNVTEGSNEPGAFDTVIDYNGNENTEVKVYFDIGAGEQHTEEDIDPNNDVNITSVILQDSGEDILDELEPEVLDNLSYEAKNYSEELDNFDADDDHLKANRYDDRFDDSVENNSYVIDEFDLPGLNSDSEVDEAMPGGYDSWLEQPYQDRERAGERGGAAGELATSHFDLNEFFSEVGSDFSWDNREEMRHEPEDMHYESKYVISSIEHYLRQLANSHGDSDDAGEFNDVEFDHDAEEIFNSQVKPEMEKEGYTFDSTSESNVDEVMQRPLPPAMDVIPGDIPHDFKSDVVSHSMTNNSDDALARLRKLAGL